MDLIKLLLASFAVYRLAQLVTLDHGPLFVFSRIRHYVNLKHLDEAAEEDNRKEADPNHKINRFGFWTGMAKGFNCPYCAGVWMAGLCGVLLMFPSVWGDLFVLAFGLAGIQSVIERFTN